MTGAEVRAWREERNLTQAQLAWIVQLTQAAVSQWERGERAPVGLLLDMALAWWDLQQRPDAREDKQMMKIAYSHALVRLRERRAMEKERTAAIGRMADANATPGSFRVPLIVEVDKLRPGQLANITGLPEQLLQQWMDTDRLRFQQIYEHERHVTFDDLERTISKELAAVS